MSEWVIFNWISPPTPKPHSMTYVISWGKNQTAKARSLGIKYMSLLDMNFDGFSSAKLHRQRISRLHVVMKKIYNMPEKYELAKFMLPVIKIDSFFCGFHFLVSRLCCLIPGAAISNIGFIGMCDHKPLAEKTTGAGKYLPSKVSSTNLCSWNFAENPHFEK